MGKNSKARRDARAKARQRTARAAAGGTLPRSLGGHDGPWDHHHHEDHPGHVGHASAASSVAMLEMMWARLDPARDGVCAGPMIVHRLGDAFECHGSCDGDVGASAMKTWHDAGNVVWQCDDAGRPEVDEMYNLCPACMAPSRI